MDPDLEFFDKIQSAARIRMLLDQLGLEDESSTMKELRNMMCKIWACASDDDLLTYAARVYAELGIRHTVEELHEIRSAHQIHLALGQSH